MRQQGHPPPADRIWLSSRGVGSDDIVTRIGKGLRLDTHWLLEPGFAVDSPTTRSCLELARLKPRPSTATAERSRSGSTRQGSALPLTDEGRNRMFLAWTRSLSPGAHILRRPQVPAPCLATPGNGASKSPGWLGDIVIPITRLSQALCNHCSVNFYPWQARCGRLQEKNHHFV